MACPSCSSSSSPRKARVRWMPAGLTQRRAGRTAAISRMTSLRWRCTASLNSRAMNVRVIFALYLCGFAEEHGVEFGAVDGFDFDEMLGDGDEFVFFLAQDVERGLVGLVDEAGDLLVDAGSGLRADGGVAFGILFHEDIAERTHAELADHAARDVGHVLDILAGAGGDVAKDDLLRRAPAHGADHLCEQFGTAHEIAVFGWRLYGHAESHTPGDGLHFAHRVGAGHGTHDDGMADLVVGDDGFFGLVNHAALALRAGHDTQDGLFKVVVLDDRFATPGGEQRALVEHVGEVGAGETGGLARQIVQGDIFGQRLALRVDFQDGETPANIGLVQHDLAVEATGAQQSGVEDIWPVGGGDDDNVGILLEAIHLDEQLIERLLALIVAAQAGIIALAANGIDFVDEDDAGRVVFGLFEEVAHARCANADEHLDKFRAAHAIEGDIGLAGHRTGDKRFARAGRADEQHPFGNTSAHAGETFRVLEKFDNLL